MITWTSITEEGRQVAAFQMKWDLIIGFIRVEEDGRTIVLPDYSGNLFYSTLGSIESDRITLSIDI